jgi:transposase
VLQIEEFVRQGVSRSEVSRPAGFDPKTIRKYLQQGLEAPRYGPRQARTSKVGGFKPYIEGRRSRSQDCSVRCVTPG